MLNLREWSPPKQDNFADYYCKGFYSAKSHYCSKYTKHRPQAKQRPTPSVKKRLQRLAKEFKFKNLKSKIVEKALPKTPKYFVLIVSNSDGCTVRTTGTKPEKCHDFHGTGALVKPNLTGTNGRAVFGTSDSAHQTMSSLVSREVSKPGKISTADKFVAQKKQEAIEKVVSEILEWFDKRLYLMAQIYGHASSTCGNTSEQPGNFSSGKGKTNPTRPPGGQKRSLQGDEPDGSATGGDGNGRDNRGGKRSKKASSNKRRLACPFYKHNPLKHGNRGACSGPGWVEFHRLKEHLTRCHAPQANQCVRCRTIFESGKALATHSRARVACEVDESEVLEEITPEVAETLRKKSSGKPDEERWRELYRLIYPDQEESTIPSPYYDLGLDENFVALSHHLRKNLAPLVTREVEKQFEDFGDEVKKNMEEVVRSCVTETLRTFQQTRPQTAARRAGETEDESLLEEPSVTVEETPEDAPSITDGLTSFLWSDPLFSGFTAGFDAEFTFDDPVLRDLGINKTSERASDSGYSGSSSDDPLEELWPNSAI